MAKHGNSRDVQGVALAMIGTEGTAEHRYGEGGRCNGEVRLGEDKRGIGKELFGRARRWLGYEPNGGAESGNDKRRKSMDGNG